MLSDPSWKDTAVLVIGLGSLFFLAHYPAKALAELPEDPSDEELEKMLREWLIYITICILFYIYERFTTTIIYL